MRNRKAFRNAVEKAAEPQIAQRQVADIEIKLKALSRAISDIEARGADTTDLVRTLRAVRDVAQRPSEVACRAHYDADGKVVSIICTSDPAEVAQIKKTNNPH